jgi:transcriptional regulator with XRE-family HTH domain
MSAPVQVGPSPSGGGPVPFPDWDETLADIGDRIRAERQARRWTQGELGDQAGLSRRTVRNLEQGIGTLRAFMHACRGLGVPMDHLLSPQWQMPAREPSLSARQVEILRVIADGKPLTVAAGLLGMPRDGLTARLSQIYRRLGVSDRPRGLERRAAAVRVAMQHGLFDSANRTS